MTKVNLGSRRRLQLKKNKLYGECFFVIIILLVVVNMDTKLRIVLILLLNEERLSKLLQVFRAMMLYKGRLVSMHFGKED